MTPDDLKYVAVSVLAHRLVLETKTRHCGIGKEEVVREILANVSVP